MSPLKHSPDVKRKKVKARVRPKKTKAVGETTLDDNDEDET